MKNRNEDTFEIYQVKSGVEHRDYRFESIESLEKVGLKVNYDNYDFIYKGDLENMDLEDIFMRFNDGRPDDYSGRSLSVSDVVVLDKDGQTTANFVDSFGFKKVPEFLVEREKANQKDFSVLKKLAENKEKVIKKDKVEIDKKMNDLSER
jgi:hypothetical protein